MGILNSLTGEVVRIYNKDLRLKPSAALEKESITLEKKQGEPKDTVQISSEAKKKLIVEQAKNEIMERIRNIE